MRKEFRRIRAMSRNYDPLWIYVCMCLFFVIEIFISVTGLLIKNLSQTYVFR